MNSNQVVLENPHLLAGKWKQSMAAFVPPQPQKAPDGIVDLIPEDAYKAYVSGKDRACIDLLLCTRTPEGPAVLLSKRSLTGSYGNTWWMYGGALPAYMPMEDFIAKRTQQESGIIAATELVVGVYRVCAPDQIDSSLTVCFATEVPYETTKEHMRTDNAHQEVRLFTFKELDSLPSEEKHWYPMRVAELALKAL